MFEASHKEVKPGVVVLTLSGKLTIGVPGANVDSLAEQLLGAGARALIFDLQGVTHLDSTGIGRFVAAMNSAMEAGAQLLMANASPQSREAFRVTRLDSVFPFYDSVEAALAALG